MGNEQSGTSNSGISSSLSFLAGRKSGSVKKKVGQIIVVRSGSENLPNFEDDQILKRFKVGSLVYCSILFLNWAIKTA